MPQRLQKLSPGVIGLPHAEQYITFPFNRFAVRQQKLNRQAAEAPSRKENIHTVVKNLGMLCGPWRPGGFGYSAAATLRITAPRRFKFHPRPGRPLLSRPGFVSKPEIDCLTDADEEANDSAKQLDGFQVVRGDR